MDKLAKLTVIILLWVMMVNPAVMWTWFLFDHESVHKSIYSKYGVDSSLELNYPWSENPAYCQANETQLKQLNQDNPRAFWQLQSQHAEHEITSFHGQTIMVTAYLSSAAIFMGIVLLVLRDRI